MGILLLQIVLVLFVVSIFLIKLGMVKGMMNDILEFLSFMTEGLIGFLLFMFIFPFILLLSILLVLCAPIILIAGIIMEKKGL